MIDDGGALDSLPVVKLWTLLVAFERRLALELADLGLSVAAFRLIGEVMREPDGVRQGDLARRLGVTPPTVSAALARLEQDGVIVRAPDPEDTRARRVHIAPGASLLSGVEVLARLDTQLGDGFSDTDRSRVVQLLDRMILNLRSPDDPLEDVQEGESHGA